MSRALAALLALGTVGAIGWHAYWSLPQARLTPGLARFFFAFSAGLALPYLVAVVLLARRRGRDGLRLAFASALVNAVWALPLAALLVLFGGFTMGNHDQEQQLLAVASAALLQLPLLAVAGAGLWRTRSPERGSASAAWSLAFALPMLASLSSWLYADWEQRAFKARAERAARSDAAALEAVQALQGCLAAYQERGYPANLEACPDAAARMAEASGHRFEYLPSLADASGRAGAFLLCAQPIEFRVTGSETVVADASGSFGAGVAAQAAPDAPPSCASVLGPERAIAYCAYARAASEPAKGYPARLAEIAPCVSARRTLRELGADRLTAEPGEQYAYLAAPPDASGRIARFRIYRFGLPGGNARWIDDQLRSSEAKTSESGPVVAGLPAAAAPERFAAGCAGGSGADCFVEGYEWQRRARQTGSGEREPSVAALREAALAAFERGCALDDARSCAWLATELEDAIGAERDVVRAAALYEKACALRDALGCHRAAEMYESGRKARPQTLPPPPAVTRAADLPRDVARAVGLYARACDLGDADACFIAARLLAAGDGVEPDRGRAFALFARLCEDGMALACSRAADLEPARRSEYLRRACVLGGASECSRAAE
jgi:TPR repeat protein